MEHGPLKSRKQTHWHNGLCSLIVRKTEVQSRVETYQRLKNSTFLLNTHPLYGIGEVKGVAPSLKPRCSSYSKGSSNILRVEIDEFN